MTYRKGNKITALVVEDEERIAAGICNKITGMDDSFEIIGRASNGEEALEIIENLHPQVVFTDIAMPVMDGMELAKNIRRNSPNTIVVIISGFSDFTYAQQSMKYGVFNYLLKPLQDDALQETLFDIKKVFPDLMCVKTDIFSILTDTRLLQGTQKNFFLLIFRLEMLFIIWQMKK